MFAGRFGFGADSPADWEVSPADSAALEGRTIRDGGDDGGIVLSLMPFCANASPHPATINVTAMASLEKVDLCRRAFIMGPFTCKPIPVSIRLSLGSRL